MADFTAGPGGADVGIPAGKFVNVAAAAVSVALIGGVGVWGYKLLMRDVTGVPVVQAMAGDMRVAPENPGGEIATHVGLAVNAVPAEGGAAAPEDTLVLAPDTSALQAEDLEVAPVDPLAGMAEVVADAVAAAPAMAPAEEEPAPASAPVPEQEQAAAVIQSVDPNTPLTAEDVLALADQIAAGAAPMTDLAAGEDAPVAVAVNGVALTPGVISEAVPGLTRSLRPTARPGVRAPAAAPVATPVAAQAQVTGQVTTAALPAGTKLVQLGAFDSADIAAGEWVRLTATFPDYFAGKEQIIQQATSGGRTFFRLRATGFADLSDARRFCSTLDAEGAPCIPVVVR